MGSPTVYYYAAGSRLTKVTLPYLSRWEEMPAPQLASVLTGDLSMVQVVRGTRRRYRITLERCSMLTTAGRATWREVQAVVSHLQAGGTIGLSADHSKTWAGYPSGGINAGFGYATWQGNAFRAWNSTAAPAAGDDLILETAPVYGLTECHKVSGLTNNQIALSDTVVFDHAGMGSLVRHAFFLPACKLPSDTMPSQMLTNEHGINFSLELVLEMDARIYMDPDNSYGLADFGLGDTSGSMLDAGGALGAALAQRASQRGGLGSTAGTAQMGYGFLQKSLGRL